ncbi:MAG: bifunctional 4-hydroxy-2-oxoglutarate aldolase/2-dehydro-3-deoxy-phosphogluconate aldolase [Thermoguttaceae bacterium]
MSTIFDRIAQYKIVPVIAIDAVEAAIPLADSLIAGGLPIAEITFRTQSAASVLHKMSQERPELLLGAGTILTLENLQSAIDAGAQFGVAPGFNPVIVDAAQKKGFPFIPGVCTPTEVEAALEKNAKVLKFFPAGSIGGLSMLQSLLAPYAHTGVQFMPTGGITPENVGDYLQTKGVIACGGTWIATKDDIAQGKWSSITNRCQTALEKCR